MRRFEDSEQRAWDVVVGRESWGTLYALFVPVGTGRDEPVRQTMLDASGYDEAHALLDGLDEDELRALLERSTPKDA